ncbi:BtrH N-terminal domain-containing protein [Streptomyces sp. NPDC051771]|uniref:BtrH N-terminal domain-containing protein n=1 Tax=Streptomyces sp. NPDC051771 TaxID=3154847 RepID=UPI00342E79F7
MSLLGLTPALTGTAPFGSCYQQAAANLASWKGLDHAAESLCTTWGFFWGGGPVLDGSGRWSAAAAAVHRMDLADRTFGSWDAAEDAARASLDAGHPVAAAVDAFHLPSPYEDREHIAHCVLLLAHEGDRVWISDPMNRPEPTAYSAEAWRRMRSAEAAGSYRTLLLTSGPRHPATPLELATAVREDARSHRSADRAAFEGYLAAREAEAADPAEVLDVSGVAAERLYLGQLFKRLAGEAGSGEEAAAVAEGFTSLSRRWYLLHTLSRESGGSATGRARLLRMLADLGDRETRLTEAVDALVSALTAQAR